jgi:hypothetical protein
MDPVSQQLLDLADRYDREIAAKQEKREKLDREIEELQTKSKALRLSARELEAAAEVEDGEQRGKNSASEFREVAIRLLSTEHAGLHHKEFRERLAKQGHLLEEKQARVLVYNLARQFDKTFAVSKGVIKLLKKPDPDAASRPTALEDDPFGEGEAIAPVSHSRGVQLPPAPSRPLGQVSAQSSSLPPAPPAPRQAAPSLARPVLDSTAPASRPAQPQPTRVPSSPPPAQAAPKGGASEDNLPF